MKNKQLTSGSTARQWEGYTLADLRFARMLAFTRIEIQRAKLIDAAESTVETLPFVGQPQATATLLRSFTWAEYLFFAVKLYKKVAPLFKKNK